VEDASVKRSAVNRIMRDADSFIRSHGFRLPPFAYWRPTDWAQKGQEVSEIVENQLGWDITDFGLGNYENYGLFLFTVRNGHPRNLARMHGKVYAEKIMVVGEGQLTPMHFHWTKVEDIINRGGAPLAIQLFNSTPNGELDEANPVAVSMDGVRHVFPPGHTALLGPGESITLETGMYHKFWGEGGAVLIGEVSMVNDDDQDNRFHEKTGRFPTIEEDEELLYLLVKDYPAYYRG
jgi:D-lyxose ketol-isomerase